MEFATALLLRRIDDREHFGSISPELPQQIDAMLARASTPRSRTSRRR